MDWSSLRMIAGLSGLSILSFVYIQIYFSTKEKFVGILALAWICLIGRYFIVLPILHYSLGNVSAIGSILLFILNLVFTVYGIFLFLGRPIPKKTIYAGVFIIVVPTVILFLISDSFALRTFPGSMATAYLRCMTGYAIFTSNSLNSSSKWLVGLSLTAYGINQLLYPFLGDNISYAPFAMLIVSFLELMICIGLLVAFFQTQQMELAEAMDTLEEKVAERTASLVSTNAALIEQKARLRKLALELAETEERERRRIAHDLHDGIGHGLIAAKLNLEMLEEKDYSLGSGVREIIDIVDQTIKWTRSLTGQLSPPVLNELGLGAAIEWLKEDFGRRFGLEIELINRLRNDSLSKEVATFMFRAATELLVNVAKHSNTKNARLLIEDGEGQLALVISDNGTGFESHIEVGNLTGSKDRGLGLHSISERAKALGGKMDLSATNDDGTGTTISVVVSV